MNATATGEVRHDRPAGHIEARDRNLDPADRRIVDQVDTFLARGLALQRWWKEAQRGQDFERRFELAFTFNRPDVSYGFFGRAPVEGQLLPVLGNYQTQFYETRCLFLK